VFNFKSIQKETELNFARLTLFAGANSSGKSTVLQSILLISQTLAHKIGSRSVVLNGALTQLGQLDDLRAQQVSADQINIGWVCRPAEDGRFAYADMEGAHMPPAFLYGRAFGEIRELGCELSFDADASGPQRELAQLQPRLFSSELSLLSRNEDDEDVRSWVRVTRTSGSGELEKLADAHVAAPDGDTARASLQYDVALDPRSLAELRDEWATAELCGGVLRHFLPDQLTMRIDRVEERALLIHAALIDDSTRIYRRRSMSLREAQLTPPILDCLRALLGDRLDRLVSSQPTLFGERERPGISLRDWTDRIRQIPLEQREHIRRTLADAPNLRADIVAALRAESPDRPRLDIVPFRPPGALFNAVTYLDRFFSSAVKYLGPLRDEPKPLYPLVAAADPTDVGLRGEMTAAVLDLHKNQKIRYIPSSAFKPDAMEKTMTVRSLEAAVVDWLHYLGVAEGARSIDLGKLGHGLKVRLSDGGPEHDLTHVGVGVSQVLPILVMCLLARPDTTLIFEQPELHLHPRVQTRLADFFLSIILRGKQCLIETHSEYLISRLRYRAAAEKDENRVTPNLQIYFVEKKDGNSLFREIKVNDYGAIIDWPEGFFDQSQREAEDILRAAMEKKQEARRRKSQDA
jgi:predicted ATPase